MGFFGGILAAAAALVAVWYFYSVIWASTAERRSQMKAARFKAKSTYLISRAADLEVAESRISSVLERRQSQPIFEVIQVVSRIPGKEIVLCRNVGGVARNAIAKTAASLEIFVSPLSFEPDEEVQFTFSGILDGFSIVAFDLAYTDTAGVQKIVSFEYDKEASTMGTRAQRLMRPARFGPDNDGSQI